MDVIKVLHFSGPLCFGLIIAFTFTKISSREYMFLPLLITNLIFSNVDNGILLNIIGVVGLLFGLALLPLNAAVIFAINPPSTSWYTYMFHNLYNAVTPLLIILYGLRCRSIAAKYRTPAFHERLKSTAKLWLLGAICIGACMNGAFGNSTCASFRIFGDLRLVRCLLENFQKDSTVSQTIATVSPSCAELLYVFSSWLMTVKEIIYYLHFLVIPTSIIFSWIASLQGLVEVVPQGKQDKWTSTYP